MIRCRTGSTIPRQNCGVLLPGRKPPRQFLDVKYPLTFGGGDEESVEPELETSLEATQRSLNPIAMDSMEEDV
jgi:hypothetical protein